MTREGTTVGEGFPREAIVTRCASTAEAEGGSESGNQQGSGEIRDVRLCLSREHAEAYVADRCPDAKLATDAYAAVLAALTLEPQVPTDGGIDVVVALPARQVAAYVCGGDGTVSGTEAGDWILVGHCYDRIAAALRAELEGAACRSA